MKNYVPITDSTVSPPGNNELANGDMLLGWWELGNAELKPPIPLSSSTDDVLLLLIISPLNCLILPYYKEHTHNSMRQVQCDIVVKCNITLSDTIQ